MNIFSELYGAYYNAVAAIIGRAVSRPVGSVELRGIIEEHAFGESCMSIEPAISEQRWQLLLPNGSTPIKHEPTMPLSTLQKRWMKAVSLDPRIRLFGCELPELDGVEPLFTPEDICVFDRYSDGDPYNDPEYIHNFRLILGAIRGGRTLRIDTLNRRGESIRRIMKPEYLEYSEKDDKFRVIGTGRRYGNIINLARIQCCDIYDTSATYTPDVMHVSERRTLVLELVDERNALERVLLHFAHFEKQAEQLGDGRYRVTLVYDSDDETEIVIRVLSFGPMVKVTAPEHFVGLIKERLEKQKNHLLS